MIGSALALVFLVFALNITVGAVAFHYVVSFLTHYIKGTAVSLGWLVSIVGGLVTGEVVIPLAIVLWLLSSVIR